MPSITSLFSTLLLATTLVPVAIAQRPTASIPAGKVVGTTTQVAGATHPAVKQYLGVPFAQSPPIRFAPPTAHKKFSGPYDASKRKASCIQQFSYPKGVRNFTMAIFNNPPPPSESEDCLYLNIFAPTSASPTNRKPVMFWIYGGNLNFGYGGLPFYDGSSFAANQDVVVVTINYRTNVFGFPGANQLPNGKKNVGFLDQRMALQWVSSNIAAFGGAADKITIFGESAGGYSVKQLLALPPKPLTYRAAIMESQAVAGGTSPALSFQQLATAVNCTVPATQIACLRKVPAKRIKSVAEHQMLTFGSVQDGITDAGSSIEPKLADGSAAKVPFVIGTNANEGSAFTLIILGMSGVDPSTFNSNKNRTAALQALLPSAPPAVIKAIDLAADPSQPALDVASDALTLAAFQCPAKKLSNAGVAAGYSVWRYHYAASYANFQPFEGAGVFHSAEIPAVWGTFAAALTPNAREKAISKYMQTEWANFAKAPLGGPLGGWPKLGSQAKDLNEIGGKTKPYGATNITQQSIDALCPLLGGSNLGFGG